MALVSEWIVKEYFEWLGYMVWQPCKHGGPARNKRPEEYADFLIVNPQITESHIPDTSVWTTEDLGGVARAVVSVVGWHTDRFYSTTFENMPDLFRFVSEDALRASARRLGGEPARILCLPQLPASDQLKGDALRTLKQKGIDGILTFRTLLWELVNSVDVNNNYEKSDILQTIRILKNYDILRDAPQMELFAGKPRRTARKPLPPDETVPPTPAREPDTPTSEATPPLQPVESPLFT